MRYQAFRVGFVGDVAVGFFSIDTDSGLAIRAGRESDGRVGSTPTTTAAVRTDGLIFIKEGHESDGSSIPHGGYPD